MARTRQKASPKPVSGPGKMSQRTDLTPQGAAASRGQPVRLAPGGAYGERQALEAQQQGAPMAAPGSAIDPRMVDAANAPEVPAEGAFGPTRRPNEPITAGIPFGPGANPPRAMADPDMVLQALFAILPHPEIARLLQAGNL